MSTPEPSPERAADRLRRHLATGLRGRVGASPLRRRAATDPKWRPLRIERRPRIGPDLPHPPGTDDDG